jgi:hypothetical protein
MGGESRMGGEVLRIAAGDTKRRTFNIETSPVHQRQGMLKAEESRGAEGSGGYRRL